LSKAAEKEEEEESEEEEIQQSLVLTPAQHQPLRIKVCDKCFFHHFDSSLTCYRTQCMLMFCDIHIWKAWVS